jgi:site-specific DNA recombinase
MKKLRAAIYSRISTAEQIERTEYDSMQSHMDRCKHYIQAQDNWELVKTYEDPAESGDKFNRPKLQEMLSDVREGKIDVIVTIRLDRISRSVRDFHEILKLLEENGVSLVSVTQGIDTSTPAGRLLRNILIDFAQFERDMISDRVKEKRLARAKKGMWNGGIPPYGYMAKDRKLVMHPEEGKVVKMMFEVYARTKSMAQVHNELDLRGIEPRSGKSWQRKTIDNILSNPIYAGKLYENGKYYDGNHEALIEENLFFSLNEIEPKRVHAKTKMDRVFLLRGLARCGHHDCAMTPYYAKGRGGIVYYYRCVKKQNYRDVDCPVAYTKADELEGYVVGKLKEISAKKEIFEKIVEQVNLELESAASPYQKEIEEVNARIKQIEKEIENFLDAVGKSGGKVVSLLEKKVGKLQDDLKELEKRKGELATLIAGSPPKVNAQIVLDSLKDFSGLYETFLPAERAECLQRIIRDVVVKEDEVIINIYGLSKPPSFGSKNHVSWLPGQDSNLQPSG